MKRLFTLAVCVSFGLTACQPQAAQPHTVQLNTVQYEGSALDEPAPEFTLTDQNGDPVALADLRGQVVVLAPLDSRCEDVCPLLAVQLRHMAATLGERAGQVSFVGLNTNAQAAAVADVRAASDDWRLTEVPTWRFLTGSAEELAPVWEALHIGVTHAASDHASLHTAGLFLIDPTGRLRWYISTAGMEGSAALEMLVVSRIAELLES